MSQLPGIGLYNHKPSPIIYSVCAAVLVFYAVYRFWRIKRRVAQIKLGRDGERVVAQYLEWFRSSNYFVFHDIPSGDANVDHVLIGPKGVFTIETKSHSKPLRGECRVTVKDGAVRANGMLLERNPIIQAKAQATWLRNFLAESQFKAPVWPVVVFPGWFVEPFDTKAVGAWVLELKALSKFIENEPDRLSREQVQATSSALRSYIRTQLDKLLLRF
jgi:Nuclease-related domain